MSKADNMRKRLEELNRGPLRRPPADDADAEAADDADRPEPLRDWIQRSRRTAADPRVTESRGPDRLVIERIPRPAPPGRRRDTRPAGAPIDLEQAAPGIVEQTDRGGVFYLVERGLEPGDPAEEPLRDAVRRALMDRPEPIDAHLRRDHAPSDLDLDDLVFFDLETTGLGSSPLFLIGAMTVADGRFVTRQYFARDYSEEPAALARFLDDVDDKRLLVSFNGKSFDLPYLRTRAAATRVPFGLDLPHLDLLHVARRVWRRSLPNCRLQTIERFVCGRPRHDDIPSAEVPDAYHEFVRTGDARRMASVLEHNRLDLVTLAEIIARLSP